MTLSISTEDIQRTIDFHGHNCPGLAIGIRVAELCLKEFGHNSQTPIVGVCETDMCGVDAIQFLTGCSVGKGNLLFKDYGKNAFTFFRRSDGKGFRALLNPDFLGNNGTRMFELMAKKNSGNADQNEIEECETIRATNEQKYLQAELDQMFIISKPQMIMPRPAKVLHSLTCEHCKERIMESRSRRFDDNYLCISCFEKVEQKI